MQSRRSSDYSSQPPLPFPDDGSGLSNRLPPQNLDAERGVLGAILLDNNVLHDVVSLLRKPDDFYRDAHVVFYKTMCDMYNRGITIDAITIADELTRQGVFKSIGGNDLLADIANSVPHAANARYHADIVKQKAITRKWIEVSTDIIRMGYSDLYTSKQIQEEAEKAIYAIADDRTAGSTIGCSEAIEEFMENIQRAKDGEFNGVSTGLPDLDRLLKGLMDEKMYVLAARTGEGKTALALRIAQHVGIKKNSTLFVSLEMGRDELNSRWIAALSKIDSQRLIDNEDFSVAEHGEIAKAAVIMKQARIHISDSPNQTLMDITACARRLKQRDNLSLVVVDYMSLISESHGKNENRVEVVGRLSRGMKLLARELKVPVLVLHQLNRESVKEKEKQEPKLHHLRESGSVEQDADVVILLNSLMEETDKNGMLQVIVAKHRGGPRGRFTLWYDKRCNTFESMAKPGQIREAEPPHDYPSLDDFDSDTARPF